MDIAPQLISSAGQTLAEAIEDILSDMSTMQGGNTTGFEHLVTILESTETEIAESDHGKVNGEGCIENLLIHMHHPKFIEICRQNKLTTALINAMRMLRMYETKLASLARSRPNSPADEVAALALTPRAPPPPPPPSQPQPPLPPPSPSSSSSAKMTELSLSDRDSPAPPSVPDGGHGDDEAPPAVSPPPVPSPQVGTTYGASQRICTLLAHLLGDAEILQGLKPDIVVKLLTYPLTALPQQGVHLQQASARVVSSMCRSPLSAQTVMMLSENHAISHMVAYLKELTSMPSSSRLAMGSPISPISPSGPAISAAPSANPTPTSAPLLQHAADTARTPRFDSDAEASSSLPPDPSTPSRSGGSTSEQSSPFADIPVLIERTLSEISEDLDSDEASTPGNSPQRLQAARIAAANAASSVRAGSCDTRLQYAQSPASILAQSSQAPSLASHSHDGLNNPSKIVKGIAAERLGMWVQGLLCLVDVITASVSFGPDVMSDFESAGGHKLLVHILSNSSQANLMGVMQAISRLLSDPHKGPEEPVSFPTVAASVAEVLISSLQLKDNLSASQDIEDLVQISATICAVEVKDSGSALKAVSGEFDQSGEGGSAPSVLWKASLVQNVAYTLLTLYSNQPQNCQILETAYNFLPMLLLTAPALGVRQEAVLAVLTTLSYVCQCVEGSAQLSLSALCASTAVVVSRALQFGQAKEDRVAAARLLETLLSTVDTIVRARPRYAMQLLRCGLLSKVVCAPLEKLCASVQECLPIEDLSAPVYSKLIETIVSINSQSPFAADEIRRSGLHVNVRNLVKSPLTSPAFAAQLLELPESLARSDTSHLSESVQTVIDVLRKVRGDFRKIRVVLVALSRILWASLEAPLVWRRFNGIEEILDSLAAMEGLFGSAIALPGMGASVAAAEPSPNQRYYTEEDRRRDAFECLQCAVHCMSLDLSLHDLADLSDHEHQLKHVQFKANFAALARRLHRAGLWNSAHADETLRLVFSLVSGQATSAHIVNSDAAQAVLEIFPSLSEALRLQALQTLEDYACARLDGRQLLVESGLVRLLVERFAPSLQRPQDAVDHAVLRLVTRLLMDYLNSSDLAAVFRHVLRVDIAAAAAGIDPGALVVFSNSFRMLPPWAQPPSSAQGSQWQSLALLRAIALKALSVPVSVPYISLGLLGAADPSSSGPAFLSMALSESNRPFPSTAFSLSCWVQIPPPPSSQSLQRFRCDSDNFQEATMATLFALSCPSSQGVFFEAVYDAKTSSVTVYLRREASSSKVTVLRFVPPSPTGRPSNNGSSGIGSSGGSSPNHGAYATSSSRNEWKFVAVTLRKPKRFNMSMSIKSSATSNISVFINGLQCVLADKDTWTAQSVEYDLASAVGGHSVQLTMGKSSIAGFMPETDKARPIPATFAPYIRLGPVMLFDEALERAQLSWLFLKGHGYSGVFNAGAPLRDVGDGHSLPLCEVLCKCRAAELSVEAFCEQLGLKDLDALDSVTPLPPAIVALNANNAVVTQKSHVGGGGPVSGSGSGTGAGRASKIQDANNSNNNSGPLKVMELSLLNTMDTLSSENRIHVASVEHGWHRSSAESLAQCVAALGGPVIFLPLVHAAASEAQLAQALQFLRVCARRSPENQRYLRQAGYEVLGLLLSKKSKSTLTASALDTLFEFAVDHSASGEALRSRADSAGGSRGWPVFY